MGKTYKILIVTFILFSCSPVALPSIERGMSYSFGVSYVPYNIESFPDTSKNTAVWGVGTVRYGVPPAGKYIGYRIGYVQYIPWGFNLNENIPLQIHDMLSYGFVDLQLQFPYRYIDISTYSKFAYGIPVEASIGAGKEFQYIYPYIYSGWIYSKGLFLTGGIEVKIKKHFSFVLQPSLFYEKIELFKENRINFAISGYFYFY